MLTFIHGQGSVGKSWLWSNVKVEKRKQNPQSYSLIFTYMSWDVHPSMSTHTCIQTNIHLKYLLLFYLGVCVWACMNIYEYMYTVCVWRLEEASDPMEQELWAVRWVLRSQSLTEKLMLLTTEPHLSSCHTLIKKKKKNLKFYLLKDPVFLICGSLGRETNPGSVGNII